MLLKAMLIFVPISIALRWTHVEPIWVFAASCLAIVPLADRLAKATEQLAEILGPTLGGMLNATLGNAPEMIIGGFALSKGLHTVVKASISGSILMNLLLSLGIAMTVGGIGRQRQTFNKTGAGVSAALLTLASIGLIVPALFRLTSPSKEGELSLEIAAVLFVLYLLSLLFTLGTHRQLFATVESSDESPHKPRARIGGTLAKLAAVTGLLALCSESMTDSLVPAIKVLGLSQAFAGIIVLASLGNIAELFSAARFARADKMDLAVGTTVGASTQVALAVAPILVFASHFMVKPLDLLFSPVEIVAITLAVVVTGQFTRDGESHWLEGAMLIAVYLLFAMGFYFSGV